MLFLPSYLKIGGREMDWILNEILYQLSAFWVWLSLSLATGYVCGILFRRTYLKTHPLVFRWTSLFITILIELIILFVMSIGIAIISTLFLITFVIGINTGFEGRWAIFDIRKREFWLGKTKTNSALKTQ